MRKQRGFTLIEMMVVFCILAIVFVVAIQMLESCVGGGDYDSDDGWEPTVYSQTYDYFDEFEPLEFEYYTVGGVRHRRVKRYRLYRVAYRNGIRLKKTRVAVGYVKQLPKGYKRIKTSKGYRYRSSYRVKRVTRRYSGYKRKWGNGYRYSRTRPRSLYRSRSRSIYRRSRSSFGYRSRSSYRSRSFGRSRSRGGKW